MNDPIDLMQSARDLYEGTNGMSMNELTAVTGIPKRTLVLRAREEDWRKHQETKTGQSTDAAIAAAALFADRKNMVFEEVEETSAAVQVMTDPLPAERDELLKRHRLEWAAPRALSAEAVRLRNTDSFMAMERGKLAKITAETLKMVQEGERKAHGLDVPIDVPQGHVVVIERA